MSEPLSLIFLVVRAELASAYSSLPAYVPPGKHYPSANSEMNRCSTDHTDKRTLVQFCFFLKIQTSFQTLDLMARYKLSHCCLTCCFCLSLSSMDPVATVIKGI